MGQCYCRLIAHQLWIYSLALPTPHTPPHTPHYQPLFTTTTPVCTVRPSTDQCALAHCFEYQTDAVAAADAARGRNAGAAAAGNAVAAVDAARGGDAADTADAAYAACGHLQPPAGKQPCIGLGFLTLFCPTDFLLYWGRDSRTKLTFFTSSRITSFISGKCRQTQELPLV